MNTPKFAFINWTSGEEMEFSDDATSHSQLPSFSSLDEAITFHKENPDKFWTDHKYLIVQIHHTFPATF